MLLSWCGWHIQVLCNFMKMLTWACYEAFVTMAEQKGCHGDETENDATATYRLSNNSLRCRCKRKWRERVMQDGGVIPASGFPRDGGTAKEGHRKDYSITVQNSGISFNTYIRSTAVVSGYTFEAFKRDGSHSERCKGSRRSRDVVGSSCSRGDGSGSSGTRQRR